MREQIILAVQRLASRASGRELAVAPEQRLVTDLGLRSLDLAELVAVLEGEVGYDPFSLGAPVAEVRTVADLLQVYRDYAPRAVAH